MTLCKVSPQLSFPGIEIMEDEKPDGIDVNILARNGKLLKYIQITEMRIQAGGELVSNACKQTVLIKVIVHDVLARIDMRFIIQE